MKSLRDYKLNLGGGLKTEAEGITPGTAFTPPIHAIVNGVPTRILAVGDLPGASPVYLCTDATGFSTWVKVTDVTIVDGAYQPLNVDPTPMNLQR